VTLDWWNALCQRVGVTAASPSDIRAFGDWFLSPSQKAIHLIGAAQDFYQNVFCFYRKHVREMST
jgi:hypothetical protein